MKNEQAIQNAKQPYNPTFEVLGNESVDYQSRVLPYNENELLFSINLPENQHIKQNKNYYKQKLGRLLRVDYESIPTNAKILTLQTQGIPVNCPFAVNGIVYRFVNLNIGTQILEVIGATTVKKDNNTDKLIENTTQSVDNNIITINKIKNEITETEIYRYMKKVKHRYKKYLWKYNFTTFAFFQYSPPLTPEEFISRDVQDYIEAQRRHKRRTTQAQVRNNPGTRQILLESLYSQLSFSEKDGLLEGRIPAVLQKNGFTIEEVKTLRFDELTRMELIRQAIRKKTPDDYIAENSPDIIKFIMKDKNLMRNKIKIKRFISEKGELSTSYNRMVPLPVQRTLNARFNTNKSIKYWTHLVSAVQQKHPKKNILKRIMYFLFYEKTDD